jgi:hypothetical protein
MFSMAEKHIMMIPTILCDGTFPQIVRNVATGKLKSVVDALQLLLTIVHVVVWAFAPRSVKSKALSKGFISLLLKCLFLLFPIGVDESYELLTLGFLSFSPGFLCFLDTNGMFLHIPKTI